MNKAKSAVAKPNVRKFLGFSFTGGREPRRRIAPQALARFKEPGSGTDAAYTWGRASSRSSRSWRGYLDGWRGYFGFCQTPSVLRDLDQWTQATAARHRLEAVEAWVAPDLLSCDDAVSVATWRRPLLAAPMAHGGSVTVLR